MKFEGFLHINIRCAVEDLPSIERFYCDAGELLLLHIDEALLDSPLLYEQLGEAPEPFPHVYGPIQLAAVVEVQRLR